MKKYFELFLMFFKIGSLTFGGGFAMLPLIENEVVNKQKWVDSDEIHDIFAVSQSVPGVIAINSAIFIGNRLYGFAGAISAALGIILPAFVSILLILTLLVGLENNLHVQSFFAGIRAASTGLILLTIIKSATTSVKGKFSAMVAVIAFSLVAIFNVYAAWAIVFGGVAGYFAHLHKKRTQFMSQSLLLFFTFFHIGLFSFGGGYTMIPMIYQEIGRFGFMPLREFSDIVALSQMTPGPIAVNAATYVGYKSSGFLGALASTVGVSLPSFIYILIISAFLKKFKANEVIQSILSGIRPAAVGLMSSGVLFFSTTSIFHENFFSYQMLKSPLSFISIPALGICSITIIASKKVKTGPILLTFLGGFLGVLFL